MSSNISYHTQKLTVDLTHDNGEYDEESAHSLTLSHKENKSPNDKEEKSDDEDSSDDESSDDDDDELYAGLSKEEIAKLKQAMSGIKSGFEEHEKVERQQRIDDSFVQKIKKKKKSIHISVCFKFTNNLHFHIIANTQLNIPWPSILVSM